MMLPVGRFVLLLVVAQSQLAVCYRIALALKCCKLYSCTCKVDEFLQGGSNHCETLHSLIFPLSAQGNSKSVFCDSSAEYKNCMTHLKLANISTVYKGN